jgi:hypothetical protein
MIARFMPARERILKALPDCQNPRHVEALMRLHNDKINWWSQRTFARAAAAAARLAAADPVHAERIAQALRI